MNSGKRVCWLGGGCHTGRESFRFSDGKMPPSRFASSLINTLKDRGFTTSQ